MPRVLVLTSLARHLAHLLTASAPSEYTVDIQPIALPGAAKIALIGDADFLILFPGVISEDVLRAARRLKLIQLVSAGFDRMDLKLCRALGVPVANNGGTNAIDVAEHALMLILAYYRRLREMDANVRAGRWNAIDSGVSTFALHGKTVGIVGFGNIGRQVARLLQPFGVRIIYADALPATAEVEQNLAATRVELDDLLRSADVVTLHVPLNEQTHHLIGPRELEMMKPSALLVNTCRGPVVDEAALVDALQTRHIGGAALDVLEEEPAKPGHPLFALDNVLLTPHTAGVTYDTWARRGEFIMRNIQRVANGQAPLAAV